MPDFLKSFVRFLYYSQERRKVFSDIRIRKKQDKEIQQYDLASEKLIVFLVPGMDWNTGKEQISGGIISIMSICQESENLKEIHGAEVIACTYTHASLLSRYVNFDNNIRIFRFAQLADSFEQVKEVMIHLPEFMVSQFYNMLSVTETRWLAAKRVHFNILNQSIQLMPPVAHIRHLAEGSHFVTVTTAHTRYCTPEFQRLYGTPLHKFSTWVSPENYYFKAYKDKESLIVVSPDPHPMKDAILRKLEEVKGLSVCIIQNLTYEEYKQLISRAKWSITFGEGLDGYFVEPIFSGAVSFGLYNDVFFTPDFKEMSTLYPSPEELLKQLNNDISKLDKESLFKAYQQQEFDLCAKHYSIEEYRKNIASFYKKEYTYA